MDFTAILTGVGAIITAAGGVALVVREFRRRDHRAANAELAQLSGDLHRCRQVHIHWRAYAFRLRGMMADRGLDVPEPPEDE